MDKIPEDIKMAAIECANVALRNLDQDDFSFEIGMIAKFIAEERERCARIASDIGRDLRNPDRARITAAKIADAIRRID